LEDGGDPGQSIKIGDITDLSIVPRRSSLERRKTQKEYAASVREVIN
jgi:hypothetical protein